MRATTGVKMLRILGVAATAVVVSVGGAGAWTEGGADAQERQPAPDIGALLGAANGAPPVICALAAQSVNNGGWGNWNDAPATPLSRDAVAAARTGRNEPLADADVDRLITALGSGDACVREIAVRLLGSQRRSERVAAALVTRLGASEVATREVAAYGLGMVQAANAVEPLTAALRDAAPGVRGNAAWALGRMEAGRALRRLHQLFSDGDARVREAAVVAAGHIDSTGSADALVRVLERDDSPTVRRVAAWALGQRSARGGGTAALAAALGRDGDPRVREMAAWALGELEDRSAVEVLSRAAESDRSSRVRGTASWALGEMNARGADVAAVLVRVLRDESEDARLKAAWALGEVADPSAITGIREALGREQGTQARRALIRALIKSGGRSEESLGPLLTSSDPAVREAAVRGLAGRDAFNPWPWPQPRPRPFP